MKVAFSKISGYDAIIIIFTIAAIIATYIRLYFGVNFIDESYYVASAYQYSLGAKPFVDDISPMPFGILTLPFVKLYCWIIGSSDGIMLFTRHLYFVFNLLTASLVFLAVQKLLRWSTGLLVALTCVVFIPFNVPNLSYNTMGSGFFTAGCFLGIWIILNNKNPGYLFFSGLFHSLACFSYPHLIVPSGIYISLLIILPLVQKHRLLLSYILGLFPIGILSIKLFLDAGLSNILISLNYARSLGYLSGLAKFYSVIHSLWFFYPYKFALLFSLIVLYFCITKIRYKLFINAILLFPLIPAPIIYSGYTQHCGCLFSMGYLFYYSLLAPYLLLFVEQDREIKYLFYLGWLPSFIAGFVIAYNSGNGYFNTGLGMLSASLVTTIILIIAFVSLSNRNISNTNFRYRVLLAPSLVILFLVFSQYHLLKLKNMVYLDADIPKLNSKVESGPFAGLYTTHEKKNYLSELVENLNTVSRPGDKIFFYHNNFPAGYLMNFRRSAINVSFLVDSKYYSFEVRKVIEDYLQKNIDSTSVIAVEMKKLLLWNYTSRENPENDFIRKFIKESDFKKIVSKDNFTIYKYSKKQ